MDMNNHLMNLDSVPLLIGERNCVINLYVTYLKMINLVVGFLSKEHKLIVINEETGITSPFLAEKLSDTTKNSPVPYL